MFTTLNVCPKKVIERVVSPVLVTDRITLEVPPLSPKITTSLEIFAPLLMNIVSQLFAYYMTVAKGYNVDQPRNLAKSVTVE